MRASAINVFLSAMLLPLMALAQPLDWQEIDPAPAYQALLTACQASPKPFCAKLSPKATIAQQRDYFRTQYQPQLLTDSGLLTAYYLPLIEGSLTQSADYPYPVWSVPRDFKPPYATRQAIDQGYLSGKEKPLLWVKDKIDLFFLHVQGSGRVELPDGKRMSIGFAAKNGQEYRSIGKLLLDEGVMAKEEISLQSLKAWLRAHPDQIDRVLWHNPSYVFFTLKDDASAIGGQGVPLTARGSLAVDPKVIAYGTPVVIETTLPDGKAVKLLAIAQDTGSAIKSEKRADWFLGFGAEAEALAGEMKQPARFTVLK